jgi:hypothetical protein
MAGLPLFFHLEHVQLLNPYGTGARGIASFRESHMPIQRRARGESYDSK